MKYYTVKESALLLGIAEATLRNYISLGRIKSEKVYNSAVISGAEIARYKKEASKGAKE